MIKDYKLYKAERYAGPGSPVHKILKGLKRSKKIISDIIK